MLRVGDVVSVGVCATRVPIVVVLVFVGALGPRVAVSVAAFVPDVAVASCGCHDNRMDKMWCFKL